MRKATTELSRDLNLFQLTLVGVAGMVCAGIYVLTGIAAGAAGPALIVAFALNGVITLLTAMVHAELGSSMPIAGGYYVWVRQGLPGANAFFSGWMGWFAHAVAGSLYCLGFATYFVEVLERIGMLPGGVSIPIAQKIVAAAIALVIIYINYRGVSETGTTGLLVTSAGIGVLVIFILSGVATVISDPTQLQSFEPFAPAGWSGVLAAMGLTYISFEGFEIIVQAGEEVRDPRRNVPRAIFLALLIVVPIYIFVGLSMIGGVVSPTGVPTYQYLGEAGVLGLLRAGEQFVPLGSILLPLGAMFSTTSALNATTYAATRASFAMGRDHNLPPSFGSVHPQTRTPHIALLCSGALLVGMAVFIPAIEDVASAANIMFLLVFMQVNVAAITVRRKYGDKLAYGYLSPFFPYLPIAVIALQFLLAGKLFSVSPLAWYVTIGWLGLGYAIYALYSHRLEREEEITPVLAEERLGIDHERFSVLLPICEDEEITGPLKVAKSLLETEPGELILLHVVTVPDQLPVSISHGFVEETRPLMDRTAHIAEEMSMTPHLILRIGRRAAEGIIDTVEDYGANFIVMGWGGGRSADPRSIVGSNIDRVVKEANANVVVVRGDVTLPARRILVPVQHPSHGHLVAPFAASMAAHEDAYIELMHVVDEELSSRERAERASELVQSLRARDIGSLVPTVANGRPERRFRIRIETGEVVETLIEHARDFDLVIMGASRESWIRRKVWGDKTSRVAGRIDTPLMFVNLRSGRFKYNIAQFFQFFWDTDDETAL